MLQPWYKYIIINGKISIDITCVGASAHPNQDAVSTDDLYLLTCVVLMRMSRKHVGAVGKPQACRTENARFVALVSHVQQFKTYRNHFFTDIYRFIVLTQTPRSRDLVIFVMTTTTITLPMRMRVG